MSKPSFITIVKGVEVRWDLVLTVRAVREVHETFDINLADQSSVPFDVLAVDVRLLIDVLYVLCREQIVARGMTSRDFGESFLPKLLEPAARALCQSVAELRPECRDIVAELIGSNHGESS